MILRDYVFISIIFFLLFHFGFTAILFIDIQEFNWLIPPVVPKLFYYILNGLSICGIAILLFGLFSLNHFVIIAWLAYMGIIIHGPIVFLFINPIFVKMKLSNNEYNCVICGIILPLLWICIWASLVLPTYSLFYSMKMFNRLPSYIRESSRVMHMTCTIMQLSRLSRTLPQYASLIIRRKLMLYQPRSTKAGSPALPKDG